MNNQENSRRPFYTRWWAWLALLVVVIIAVKAAGSNNDINKSQSQVLDGNNTTDKTNTSTGSNQLTEVTSSPAAQNSTNAAGTGGQVVGEPVEDVVAARDNSAAKLTSLNTGTFTVGTDIPAGRYTITGEGSGNLVINDKSGIPYINEILGGGSIGVDNVTADISDGDTIQISGMNKAIFTPAETKLNTGTLTTGEWIVGLDIAPGRYDISAQGGSGNLFVYDKNGIPTVNEILGGQYGVEKVTADLAVDNKIVVSGINAVKLSAK